MKVDWEQTYSANWWNKYNTYSLEEYRDFLNNFICGYHFKNELLRVPEAQRKGITVPKELHIMFFGAPQIGKSSLINSILISLYDDQEYTHRFKVGYGQNPSTYARHGEYLNQTHSIALWDSAGYAVLNNEHKQHLKNILMGKQDYLAKDKGVIVAGSAKPSRVHLAAFCVAANASKDELHQAKDYVAVCHEIGVQPFVIVTKADTNPEFDLIKFANEIQVHEDSIAFVSNYRPGANFQKNPQMEQRLLNMVTRMIRFSELNAKYQAVTYKQVIEKNMSNPIVWGSTIAVISSIVFYPLGLIFSLLVAIGLLLFGLNNNKETKKD